MEASAIPRDELRPRMLYEVHSRNLRVAVYDGNGGFTGIRLKFSDRYLFTEYFDDPEKFSPCGTVTPVRLMVPLTAGISLDLYEPGTTTTCSHCKKRAWWTGPPAPAPWACESGCDTVTGIARPPNKALFAFLDSFSTDAGKP